MLPIACVCILSRPADRIPDPRELLAGDYDDCGPLQMVVDSRLWPRVSGRAVAARRAATTPIHDEHCQRWLRRAGGAAGESFV